MNTHLKLLTGIIGSGLVAYGFSISEISAYGPMIQFIFLFVGFFFLILLMVFGLSKD